MSHDKLLRIFDGIPPLTIDALMQPIALLANRGAGKTYGGTSIFEVGHNAGVQCIAIDSIGKWYGLCLGPDGRSRGLSGVYVLGGKYGHLPLTPTAGAQVARMLVEHPVSAILDVSHMRKHERTRFLSDFLEEFYLLTKQAKQIRPRILFFEEAHDILPQTAGRGLGDFEARLLGAASDIVAEGRNYGLGCVVMDQRPATVSKNALALMEIVVLMRTTWPDDRDVYKRWTKGEKIDFDEMLPSLQAGEGFVWAPMYGVKHATLIKIRKKKTFDSSATAKIGHQVSRTLTLPKVEITKLREAMAEVVDEVESKDVNALRRRVAELDRESSKLLQEKERLLSDRAVAEKRALTPNPKAQAAIKALSDRLGELTKLLQTTPALLARVESFVWRAKADVGLRGEGVRATKESPFAKSPPVAYVTTNLRAAGELGAEIRQRESGNGKALGPKNGAKVAPAGEVNAPQLRILAIASALKQRGLETPAGKKDSAAPAKERIGAWLGVHHRGGRFQGNFAFLQEHDYLSATGAITVFGAELLAKSATPRVTGGSDGVANMLDESSLKRVFQTIVDHGCATYTTDALANDYGVHPRGGRFQGNLKHLRDMGVIPEDGPIQLTPGALA